YIHPDTFFLFLLPPCILEAAYGLHDPVFFENLGTILFYAIFGTLINCFIIGPVLFCLAYIGAMGTFSISLIECLVFSSLIVAVDPVAVLAIFQEVGVNSVLYFLVFGESLLNDAVTVVLYNTITTLSLMGGDIPVSEIGMAIAAFFVVSLGGLTIGLIFGLLSALITRLMMHIRVVEPLAILSMAYASYLMAELFHFSGIISMIGCGLMQMQFAFHNISNNSSVTIKYFSKMLSNACDCIIFMFLGISLIRDNHQWHLGFVLWSVVLCLAVRFIGWLVVTYGLTFLVNKTNRSRCIGNREQFIMAYGGLRGAVAFCLVVLLQNEHTRHKELFVTATLSVILFTVFVQGITIKPLVKLLRIEGEEEKVMCLYQEINNHVIDHLLVFMEEVIGHYGHNSFQVLMKI
ncbi:hypothetical protein HELRODRAFT_70084, partial [Helobdella robusta]|uniref:Sodium/hydrogen exchanger n=1 Tax=Helobdella robusta TaxID=6412 RepID=T1G025_HELRO